MLCKNKKIEIENGPTRLHANTRTVKGATQTLKNLIIGNLEDKIRLTESLNRAQRVMLFTIPTGLKASPFEVH